MKQQIIPGQDPSLQYQKMPAWVRKIRKFFDPVQNKEIIEHQALDFVDDDGVTVRWHELLDRIRNQYQNATLSQLKEFYQLLAGEPYPSELAQTKLSVAKAIVQIYYPEIDLSGTAAKIFDRLQSRIQTQARLGLGCQECGRFYEFHPNADLSGWESSEVELIDTPESQKFVCLCGNIIEIQKVQA